MKSFRCTFGSKVLESTSTSLTVGAAAHGGALDHCAVLVDTPAEASGVPALHGHVVALGVTLRLVGADLAATRCCLRLAFGHDR